MSIKRFINLKGRPKRLRLYHESTRMVLFGRFKRYEFVRLCVKFKASERGEPSRKPDSGIKLIFSRIFEKLSR